MARKTIEIEKVRKAVNTFNERSDDEKADQRMGGNHLLEMMLHETGNYKGFNYLNVDHTTDPPTIPDESRRKYF